MQIKTTMRYHFTPVKMPITKKKRDHECGQSCAEEKTLMHCWWECEMVKSFGNSMVVFQQIKISIFMPVPPTLPSSIPWSLPLSLPFSLLLSFLCGLSFIGFQNQGLLPSKIDQRTFSIIQSSLINMKYLFFKGDIQYSHEKYLNW